MKKYQVVSFQAAVTADNRNRKGCSSLQGRGIWGALVCLIFLINSDFADPFDHVAVLVLVLTILLFSNEFDFKR